MKNPQHMLTAMRLSEAYFGLRRDDFVQDLADDIVFSVVADIHSASASIPDQQHSLELEGKDKVVAFLDARHFKITENVNLKEISFKPLKEGGVTVNFVSVETKIEQCNLGPIIVAYKYTGYFTVGFSEGKVNKIFLKNSRWERDHALSY